MRQTYPICHPVSALPPAVLVLAPIVILQNWARPRKNLASRENAQRVVWVTAGVAPTQRGGEEVARRGAWLARSAAGDEGKEAQE